MRLVHTDIDLAGSKDVFQRGKHIVDEPISPLVVAEQDVVTVDDVAVIAIPRDLIKVRKRLDTRDEFQTDVGAKRVDFPNFLLRVSAAQIPEVRVVFQFVSIFRIQINVCISHARQKRSELFYGFHRRYGVAGTIDHHAEIVETTFLRGVAAALHIQQGAQEIRRLTIADLPPAGVFFHRKYALDLLCRNRNAVFRKIEFQNVDFEYIPGHPVLKNINLTIKKDETLAIVGNSGGGKSTIVNLLPRFYDIKSGSIKYDGVDIRDLTISSLRHNIAMVFQDNFLFSGTIRENIMMGNPNATEAELEEAIESAQLQEMIADLPDGLDTLLGERGLTLSGGQRQRVAIARAMIKNTPIVILDEATSALDNKSEAIVQKALDNLIKNKTVFVIAHRLSTIKNADRIAVITEGELVELGNHDELMAIPNGQYRALYEMQFKKQEEMLTNV